MSHILRDLQIGDGGFDNSSLIDGVFSPGSVLDEKDGSVYFSIEELIVKVIGLHINSDVAHDMDIYYRPATVATLPSAPDSDLNDTLIYSYNARTNASPFFENDDFGRRLTDIFFGPFGDSVAAGGFGMLQYVVPAFAGVVHVTTLWVMIEPGGNAP